MTRLALSAAVLMCIAAAQDDSQDPLVGAARDGDFTRVRTLLARGAKPDVSDAQGMTPLMEAALAHARSLPDPGPKMERDYVQVAKLLLDARADVNARDHAGRSALLLATEGSASEYRVIGADEPIARLLIARGADVNAPDQLGWTPLLKVLNLWADQPALVDLLLASGADVNARLKDGRNGLMLAARLGKDDRLSVLAAKGANPDARDNTGATALMIASAAQWEEASVKMIKVLIARGANLNLADRESRTAADWAARSGSIARAQLLLDAGAKVADRAAFLTSARDYALWRALAGGEVAVARTLLDQGADPNSRDDHGATLLSIAANEEYSAEKTILLLDHGASVNLANGAGDTPLMIAADRYQADIVKALLDRGANANAVDRGGNSVLMRAAASKHSYQEERKPLVPLLLKSGANPGYRNPHGVTPLMLMALNGNPTVQLVLEARVDVDARDEDGNTALIYASRFFVRGGQRRIGWALLQKGADVNASNHNGETALILAATQFDPEAVQLLFEKGTDVNAKTKAGRTALMQAIDGPKEFDNENHVVYSPQIAKLLISVGADVNARDAAGHSALALAKKRGYQEMVAILEKIGARE